MQFGVKIVVITSEKEVPSLEIVPKSLTLERVVYLSHLVGVHYNSIYLKGWFSFFLLSSIEHSVSSLSSTQVLFFILLVVSGSETDTAPMELPGKSKNKSENDKEPQGRNENDKHKHNEKKKNDRSKNKKK